MNEIHGPSFMDFSGGFYLVAFFDYGSFRNHYTFQIKSVVFGNHQGFQKVYSILFISGEVSHCKTSIQLLGLSTDEIYQHSLQTKAKPYLSLLVCSMLSQVAV